MKENHLCRAITRDEGVGLVGMGSSGMKKRRLGQRTPETVSFAPLIKTLCWACFGVWLLSLFVTVQPSASSSPIDFFSYNNAAKALSRGKSPYPSLEEARSTWLFFHQLDLDISNARISGQWDTVRHELMDQAPKPGTYLYPPTLARLVLVTGISQQVFTVLLILAILGFSLLWIRESGAHPLFLALVAGTFEIYTALRSGNVELLLLFLTLLAAVLLWHRKDYWAAPVIAFIVLVKPFYALFFLTFGLLYGVSGTVPKGVLRRWALPGLLTLALVLLEVLSWDPTLRMDAIHYMVHLPDYLWLALSPADQTPLSRWNRTPLQAFVSAGIPMGMATVLVMALWAVLLGLTLWKAKGRDLGFARTFALAFILLYWARPVGWGLVYLEFVLLSILWPDLTPWRRIALCAALGLLMVSRKWAISLPLGFGMSTQPELAHPWEAWLALPGSWALLWWSLRARPKAAP